MIKFFNILNQALCLLLMVHLLAISVCDDYLLKLINKSSIEQVTEKGTNKDLKDKNVEFDDFENEYFVNFLNKFTHINSLLKQKSLSKVSFQYRSQKARLQHLLNFRYCNVRKPHFQFLRVLKSNHLRLNYCRFHIQIL